MPPIPSYILAVQSFKRLIFFLKRKTSLTYDTFSISYPNRLSLSRLQSVLCFSFHQVRTYSFSSSASFTRYGRRQKDFMLLSIHNSPSSSSDRRFTVHFQQIPHQHGHPCTWLTSHSVFAVRDLHPIDYVRAGRTKVLMTPVIKNF